MLSTPAAEGSASQCIDMRVWDTIPTSPSVAGEACYLGAQLESKFRGKVHGKSIGGYI